MTAGLHTDKLTLAELLAGAELSEFLPDLQRLGLTVMTLARASSEEQEKFAERVGFDFDQKLRFREALDALSSTMTTPFSPTAPISSHIPSTPSSHPTLSLTAVERMEKAVLEACNASNFTMVRVLSVEPNGMVLQVRCTHPDIPDTTKFYALKVLFNVDLSIGHMSAMEKEIAALSTIPTHSSITRFYFEFKDHVPEWMVEHLPKFVARTWQREGTGLPMLQFLVTEYAPRALQTVILDTLGASDKFWPPLRLIGDGFELINRARIRGAPSEVIMGLLVRMAKKEVSKECVLVCEEVGKLVLDPEVREVIEEWRRVWGRRRIIDVEHGELRKEDGLLLRRLVQLLGARVEVRCRMESVQWVAGGVVRLRGRKWGVKGRCLLRDSLAGIEFPCLRHLSLNSNALQEESAWGLAESLGAGACPLLRFLDISMNALGDDGARALAEAMSSGACHSLRHLDLSTNNVGDGGAQALAGALGACPSLSCLSLAYNHLQEDGVRAMAEAFTKGACRSLRFLSFFRNNLDDEAARTLAEAFAAGACPVLQTLSLRDNIIGEGAHSLVKVFAAGACPLLRRLALRGNPTPAPLQAFLCRSLPAVDFLS